MKIITATDYQSMSRKAAQIIASQLVLKENSVLGLATGSTPIGIYEQLAAWTKQGDLCFRNAVSVNLDEYCGLPADHPESYRSFMEKNLFSSIDLNPANAHLPNGNAADPNEEARRYDGLVQELGGVDLQLLGLGHNGHIGFNEPGEAFVMDTHVIELSDKTRQANARFFGGDIAAVPSKAITMGIRTIMNANKILLVVSGEEKMDILRRALEGPVTPHVPASILQLHKDLTVVCHPGYGREQ